MEEIEYIPFYGELKMTTFTSEDRKEAAKKKLKKAKPHTEEAAVAAAEMLVAQVEIEKETITTFEEIKEESKEWIKPESEFTPTDWAALNDPPEPGMVDVAATPKGANVVRRGFTTIQMAHAFRNGLKNPEEHFIVEVREGILMDGPILAHYVIHKSQEL
jgi:adenine-specific DNA methylase